MRTLPLLRPFPAPREGSRFRSAEDGWPDISGFLDQDYGFLAVVLPITEPAVAYGAVAGPVFIKKPVQGGRPNIAAVGGMGTSNGPWGAAVGDLRHWLDDRLQKLARVVYASVNLDYHGANVGGLGPSLTFDTHDNLLTPTRGTYVEATAGLFSQLLGGDDEFQRLQIIGMQYAPLHSRLFLGMRAQVGATFGEVPFYLEPFINLRGLPILRYQGEATPQLEGEVRWQFWQRFSVVGFLGDGTAWNNWERFENTQKTVAGGTGFRYEFARRHGIHAGLDLAFGPETTAIYVQMGSAWARP